MGRQVLESLGVLREPAHSSRSHCKKTPASSVVSVMGIHLRISDNDVL